MTTTGMNPIIGGKTDERDFFEMETVFKQLLSR